MIKFILALFKSVFSGKSTSEAGETVGETLESHSQSDFRVHITLDGYFKGRDVKYKSDLKKAYRTNAMRTVSVCNELCQLMYEAGIRDFTVTSGWRPPTINAQIGGAKNSAHLTCEAIDFGDDAGLIGAFLKNNQWALEAFDLYMENLRYTMKRRPDGSVAKWVHLQTRPVKSGKRVFIPYPGSPPKL